MKKLLLLLLVFSGVIVGQDREESNILTSAPSVKTRDDYMKHLCRFHGGAGGVKTEVLLLKFTKDNIKERRFHLADLIDKSWGQPSLYESFRRCYLHHYPDADLLSEVKNIQDFGDGHFDKIAEGLAKTNYKSLWEAQVLTGGHWMSLHVTG